MNDSGQRVQRGIALVEDDEVLQRSLKQRFQLEGLQCTACSTLLEALELLKRERYQLLICDVRLPDGDCGVLFQEFLEQGHQLPPTLFITAYPDLEQAVKLLKLGAADYLAKPFDVTELLGKMRRLAPELFVSGESDPPTELGVSPVMRRIVSILDRLASHHAPLLVTGESGVGKEYVARYLHQRRYPEGNPEAHPFRAINCAALPENLLEAELFGFEKGAFTGAERRKPGLFELAAGGTLLLDEVGEMPPSMQSKLLRVLQERRLTRLGGTEEIAVELDLVSATNRDLKRMVEAGEFREDLYYRLHVLHIDIPSLRERPEDILWFARRLVEREGRRNPPPKELSPAAESWLLQQSWKGNYRELKHVIQRALIFTPGSVLNPAHLVGMENFQEAPECEDLGLRDCLQESERWYIERALEQNDWHMTRTAEALKISRKNLWERMNRLGIHKRGSD